MRTEIIPPAVMAHQIILHGKLKRQFGGPYTLGVNTPAQALRALFKLLPGFRNAISEGSYRLVRGTIEAGMDLSEIALQMRLGGKELHIIPAAAGAKSGGGLKIVLGVALVAVAVATAGAAAPEEAGVLGTGKTLGAGTGILGITSGQLALTGGLIFFAGITAALSPQPKKPTQNNPSFLLGGQLNTNGQGVPVPIVYGKRIRVGSVVVSLGYTAVDYSGTNEYTASMGSSAAVDPTATGAGGGGSKSGSGSSGQTPDTLQSKAVVSIIDLLSEGPIGGLFDGPKSIFFNGTPLMAADGTYNFLGVSWQLLIGLPDQSPVPGFPAAQEFVPLGGGAGIQILQANPHTQTVISATATSLNVTVQIPSLFSQDTKNGNVYGTDLYYTFEVMASDGPWVTVVNEAIVNQKTTSAYQRTYSFVLPTTTTGSWTVRCTRITPDSTLATLQNSLYWFGYTIVTDYQLIYPDSAYMAFTIDSAAFGSTVPTRTYELAGLICQVPANFDPVNRVYSATGVGTTGGTWDGVTWKGAVTDDPCWCLYDLLSNARYGCAQSEAALIDAKFDLYAISQYAIAPVPNGYGGYEPRYLMNVCISSQGDAFSVLQSMVSNFRGMLYWGAGQIQISADMPALPVKLVSQASVNNSGEFIYEGTNLSGRHTVARVTYLDASNYFQQSIEVYENTAALSTRGQQPADIVAFGVTSRGQAHRVGRWLLDTEATQTETLTFTAGLEHLNLRPGELIEQTDPSYAGLRMGGRVRTGSTASQILLDTLFTPDAGAAYSITVVMPASNLPILTSSGVPSNNVAISSFTTSADGTYTIANLATPFPSAPNPGVQFILTSTDLAPRLWTVAGVTEAEHGKFAVTAVYYDPGKFARVELGITFNEPAFSLLPSFLATPLPLVGDITVTDFLIGVGTTTIIRTLVSFTPPIDVRVSSFEVRAVGNLGFVGYYASAGTPATVDHLAPDTYVFSVRVLCVNNSIGAWVSAAPILINGIAPNPDAVTNLTAGGGIRSITLNWIEANARDVSLYEIWRRLGPPTAGVTDPVAYGATYIAKVAGTAYIDTDKTNLEPNTTASYFVRAITTTGSTSAWTGPVSATTSLLVAADIQDGILTTAKFAASLNVPTLQTDLTTAGTKIGQIITNEADGKLYSWNGTAWAPVVVASAVNGKIDQSQIGSVAYSAVQVPTLTSAQIMALQTAQNAGTLSAAQLATIAFLANSTQALGALNPTQALQVAGANIIGTVSGTTSVDTLSASQITGLIQAAQIQSVSAAVLQGQLTASQIQSVNAAALLGTLGASQIGTVNASSLVGTLTTAQIGLIAATQITGQLTAAQVGAVNAAVITGTLAAGVAGSIPASSITGTLTSAQIGQIAATSIIGTLSDSQLAAISAAKVTGQITASQITTGTITSAQIQTGSITGDRIAGTTITAGNLAAGSVTTTQLAVGSPNNIIWNACCGISTDGWRLVYTTPNAANLISTANVSFQLTAYGSATQGTATMPTGVYFGAFWDPSGANAGVPVNANDWMAFQCLAIAINCSAFLQVNFYDGSGNYVNSAVSPNTACPTTGGGKVISDYTQIYIKFQVPAVAKRANFYIQARNDGSGTTTNVNSTAYLIWTQALIGLTNAGATGPSPWTPGGVTQITGGVIQAGSIQAGNIAAGTITGDKIFGGTITAGLLSANSVTAASILSGTITALQIATGTITAANIAGGTITANQLAAGSVTTTQLAVGSSTNTIWNSCLDISSDGWTFSGSAGITLYGPVRNTGYNPGYLLLGDGSGVIGLTGQLPANGYIAAFWQPNVTDAGAPFGMACSPGQWFEAQAMLQSHRCAGTLQLQFFDASGAYITNAVSASVYNYSSTGGATLSTYRLATVIAQAPGNAARVLLLVLGINDGSASIQGGAAGASPFVFFTHASLGLTVAGATQVSAWNPGGATSLSGGMIKTGSLQASAIVAGSITGDKIFGGTITAGLLSANSVTAASILAGTITALQIATGTITAANIAGSTITGDKIFGGTITATNLAAGSVTTTQLAVGNPTNVIWNSCCLSATDGWQFAAAGGSTSAFFIPDANYNGAYALAGYGSGIHYCQPLNYNFYEWVQWDPNGIGGVPCTPGQTYCMQALLITLNCVGFVDLIFLDANLNVVGQFDAGAVYNPAGGGTQASQYVQSFAIGVAPPTAVLMLGRILSYNNGVDTTTSSNSYLIFTQAALGPTNAGANVASPWAPGGVTQITGGVIQAASIQARNIAAGTITGDKIFGGTITAGLLAANSVTAASILAGTITSNEIKSNTITANNIAFASITGDRIAVNTISAQNIAANTITTGQLAVGSSTNVIWNSCMDITDAGWTYYNANSFGPTRGSGVSNWCLVGDGSGFVTTATLGAGQYMGALWDPNANDPGNPTGVACSPGQWFEAQAQLIAYRCTGAVQILFYDASNNTIAAVTSSPVRVASGAGASLSQYAMASVIASAPANSARVRFFVFGINDGNAGITGGTVGSAPYVFFTHCALGQTVAGATQVSSWTPGGATSISGAIIKTGTITADSIAVNAIIAGKIAAGAVTAGTIATNAVVAGTIMAGAVGATEIAAGSIRAGNLASETLITQAVQIGTGVIGTVQISDATITTAKIGSLQVGTGNVANNAITAASAAGASTRATTAANAWQNVLAVTVYTVAGSTVRITMSAISDVLGGNPAATGSGGEGSA